MHRKILLAGALALFTSGAFAQDGAWTLGTGLHYSSGDYGTSATTVFFLKSRAPLTSSAVWLCKMCCHQFPIRSEAACQLEVFLGSRKIAEGFMAQGSAYSGWQ